MSRPQLTGLWQHPNFLRLWAGATISLFGSQVTFFALTLVAAVVLNATPAQIGLLAAFQGAPALVVGLVAGVWVDRLRRRPILILSDIGRAVVLATVPVASLLGVLRMEQLYLVVFAVGCLTIVATVAAHAFLVSVVHREHLLEANAKLELSQSAALIAGPGIAGGLVQLLSAPLAILFDVLSYLLSAVCVAFITVVEPVAPQPSEQSGIRGAVRDGLRVVWGNVLLRSSTLVGSLAILVDNLAYAAYILYVTRTLALPPALLGLIFAAVGPGYLVGAVVAGRVAHRVGVGAAIAGALLVSGLTTVLIPLISGPEVAVVPLLMTLQCVKALAFPIANINQVSLRMALTPDDLQGRVNAITLVVVAGAAPIGALMGGVLSERLGLRPTLVVSAGGWLLACLWVWLSPLRHVRELPHSIERSAAGGT